MIRFQPDTWRDAIWRPLAMAAPDAGVYLEAMAPDLRFAALLLLTLCLGVLVWRRRNQAIPAMRTLGLLVVFAWLSFASWLFTTGNGRYFMPVLLLAGVLCIAILRWLPLSQGLRLSLATLLVAMQAFVVAQADPRHLWSLAPWGEPYLDLQLTPQDRSRPALYVTLSSISHSLAAPQFDARSRWISIASLSGDPQAPDERRAQEFLAQGQREGLPMRLFVPAVPPMTLPDGQPDPRIRAEMDRLLASQRLALEPGERCEIRRSDVMAHAAHDNASQMPARFRERSGFWICPLRYPVAAPPPVLSAGAARAREALDRLEHLCPRFFPPGEARTERVDGMLRRAYSNTDTRAFVTDDGQVYFRYWRALNADRVGSVDEVLSPGFTFDCRHIRGRSGLPWERVL